MNERAVTEELKLGEAIDARHKREKVAETLDLPVTFIIRHESGADHGEGWIVYERDLDGSGQIERV